VESSGTAEPQEKVVLLLRVAPSLKSWLAGYARERGLTLNAAAITLLEQIRRETGKRG
jgi:hypothetical protein